MKTAIALACLLSTSAASASSELEAAMNCRVLLNNPNDAKYFTACVDAAVARLAAENAMLAAHPYVPSGLDRVASAVLSVLTLGGRIDYAARTATPPTPATPSTFETNGFLQAQRDNGGNKLCVYNKYGQSSVITVGKLEMCPR